MDRNSVVILTERNETDVCPYSSASTLCLNQSPSQSIVDLYNYFHCVLDSQVVKGGPKRIANKINSF